MTTTIASTVVQSLPPSSSSSNSNDNLNNNSPLIMDESHFIEWLKNNCPKLLSKALSEASSVLFNGSSLSFSLTNKSDIFASQSSNKEKLTNSNNFKQLDSALPIETNKRFLMPAMNQGKKSDDNFSTSSVSGNFHQPSHYHHHYYGPSTAAAKAGNVSKSSNVTVNGPVKNDNNAGAVVKTEKPLMMVDQQHHEYIMQSHSESARNAIIYVAVILSIYLMAIAAIAIQYYHKHQTLDPFSAYLLGQNGGSRVSKDRHNRRRYLRRSSASSSSNVIAIPVSGNQNNSANNCNNSFNANNKSMFHLNVGGNEGKECNVREKIRHLQSSKRLLEQMQQGNAVVGPFTTQSSSTTTLPTTITTTKLFNPADVHFAHYPAPIEHHQYQNPNQQRNCHIFSKNNNNDNNNNGNNSFSQNQPIVVIEYGQQSSSTASSSFNNLYFDNTSDNESDLGNGNDRAGGGCRGKTSEEPTVINNNTISGNGNKKPNVYGNVVVGQNEQQAMVIVEQKENKNNGGNKVKQENQQQQQQQILINIETFDEVEKEKDNSCPKNEIKTTTGSVWIENINKQQQKRQLLFKTNKDKKTKNLFPSSVLTDESSSSFIDEVSIENEEEEEINSEDDEEEDDDDEENDDDDDDEDEEYWIKKSGAAARGQSKLKTTNLPPITSKLKNLFTFGLSAQFSVTPMISQTSMTPANTRELVTTVPSITETEHSKSTQEHKPTKRRFLMRSLSLLTETSWPTSSRPSLVQEQSFDTVTNSTPTSKSPKKNFGGKILFSFGSSSSSSRQNPINSSQIITATTANTATSITKPKYEETHL